MKVTEQIEAMEVSAINPFKYLVTTRVLDCTITVPVLGLYCGFVALMGSYFSVHANEATSIISFFNNGFSTITFLDVFTSLIKSIVFGFTIGMVGCYKGYNAAQGTLGVGRAANQAVVLAMFLVFIEEVTIVQISNWIRYF
jgi:phospholipid/cholesterol/gamma-HCH transport system permease protein